LWQQIQACRCLRNSGRPGLQPKRVLRMARALLPAWERGVWASVDAACETAVLRCETGRAYREKCGVDESQISGVNRKLYPARCAGLGYKH